MELKISVKEFNVIDVEKLVAISRETFYYTFAAENTVSDMQLFLDESFSREMLLLELLDNKNNFYGIYVGNLIAGYCKMRGNIPPVDITVLPAIEIERLYVLPEYRGKKIGAIMMKHCINTAIQRGYRSIWLGVWEHNTKAINFYERWGFEPFGSHIFMVGQDAQTDIYMKKAIS
jgi:ribosomal protein S18 acetylase RimI-like enzyme